MSFLRIPFLFSMARSVAILSLAGLELGAAGFLGAQPIGVGETQTNRDGQVTVAVTWPGPTAGPVFRVVLDTHSVDLDRYDLGALALVRGDQGSEVRPISWDAPLGGHHREGSLVFPDASSDGTPVVGPDIRTLELVIRDVGGVQERVFRWTWE